MALSEEEIQRRRDLANELVAQGKIGGARPGSGRPRKKRVSEVINEKIQDKAEEIWKVFEDSIADTSPPQIRLQAARELLNIEQKELENDEAERRALEGQTKDRLIHDLVSTIQNLSESGYMPAFDAQGDAEEIEPPEIEAA